MRVFCLNGRTKKRAAELEIVVAVIVGLFVYTYYSVQQPDVVVFIGVPEEHLRGISPYKMPPRVARIRPHAVISYHILYTNWSELIH